jgi:hypothetical protein
MFGRKKRIGRPTKLRRRGYRSIGAKRVPRQNQWRAALGGNAAKQQVWAIPILRHVDGYLGAFNKTSDKWHRLSCLGQLYFLTDTYLKEATRSPSNARYARFRPQVEDLFGSVVQKLCELLDCQINVLPQRIQDYWGRVLTAHGHGIDTQAVKVGATPVVAEYLSAADREYYRIHFDGPTAWMIERTNYKNWVLADSPGIGWEDGRGYAAPDMMLPDFAGFALSMGRELYMAHHKGSFHKDNFFHSSYMAGDSVLCTGTIQIFKGKVHAIRNDSGHYQPTIQHLINVVQTLRMHGVDPGTVWVQAVACSWTNQAGDIQKTDSPWWTGRQLLSSWRSRGLGLRYQRAANRRNIETPVDKTHFPRAPARRR